MNVLADQLLKHRWNGDHDADWRDVYQQRLAMSQCLRKLDESDRNTVMSRVEGKYGPGSWTDDSLALYSTATSIQKVVSKAIHYE